MHPLAGIQKFNLRARVLPKSILKLIQGFLEKTSKNLSSTSVKVAPLTVTSLLIFFLQKISQFWCITSKKLSTAR